MNKTLCILWSTVAVLNLVSFFLGGDFDNLHIAMLQGLLAWDRYDDYKREGH